MTDRRPEVSVVMPVFNAAPFLHDSIGSVFGQTFADWELLIVDDGSNDASWSIIESHLGDPRIRSLRRETNSGGPAIPRNQGLGIATGRYVAFLDADDVWKPSKLEDQLVFMARHGCGIAFTAYEVITHLGKPTGRVVPAEVELDAMGYLKNTVIGFSSSMVDRVHLGDLRFRNVRAEDALFWYQLLGKGRPAVGLNEILMSYRVHSGSISANKFLSSWWTWKIFSVETGLPLRMSGWCFLHRMVNSIRKRCGRKFLPSLGLRTR